MGLLSLCICGTRENLDDEKAKKSEKRKKNKKSKKHLKRENFSHNASPFSIDESARKLHNEQQIEKKSVKEKRTDASVGDRFDDCAKNQIDKNDRIGPMKIDDLPNNWSYQINENHENLKESRKNSERSVDEFDQETRGIDYDAVLLSRCASSTNDEDGEQVKHLNQKDYDEKTLDESISRSDGEPEDLSWTSEIEDKQDVNVEPSTLDRKSEERISSRINFSKNQESSKAKISSRKQSRNVLPPIKGRSCIETYNCFNEKLQGHEETNKFGIKKTPVLCEQRDIRRKLNSCSFEIRPFEDEERGGKAKTHGEGSMIPRLDWMNSIKSDKSKSEIVQNGTS